MNFVAQGSGYLHVLFPDALKAHPEYVSYRRFKPGRPGEIAKARLKFCWHTKILDYVLL
jgi:hypothetical protein